MRIRRAEAIIIIANHSRAKKTQALFLFKILVLYTGRGVAKTSMLEIA